MTKPPTAEEVLGLYRRVIDARKAMQTNPLGPRAGVRAWLDAKEKFLDDVERWMESQGPATREWFVERFGGSAWLGGGIACVAMCNDDGVYFQGVTKDATRSDIETLVRVLGGETDGKEA